jgi:hypothetical protein
MFFWWGLLLYVGLFGDVEMTWYLTKPSTLHLCRSELIGRAFGLNYSLTTTQIRCSGRRARC